MNAPRVDWHARADAAHPDGRALIDGQRVPAAARGTQVRRVTGRVNIGGLEPDRHLTGTPDRWLWTPPGELWFRFRRAFRGDW